MNFKCVVYASLNKYERVLNWNSAINTVASIPNPFGGKRKIDYEIGKSKYRERVKKTA